MNFFEHVGFDGGQGASERLGITGTDGTEHQSVLAEFGGYDSVHVVCAFRSHGIGIQGLRYLRSHVSLVTKSQTH